MFLPVLHYEAVDLPHTKEKKVKIKRWTSTHIFTIRQCVSSNVYFIVPTSYLCVAGCNGTHFVLCELHVKVRTILKGEKTMKRLSLSLLFQP